MPRRFGLGQTSARAWCRAQCLRFYRRNMGAKSREGGKKVGVVEATQPFVSRQGAYHQCPCLVSHLALVCRFFLMPGWVASRLDKPIWPFFWAGKRDLLARRTNFCPKFACGFGLVDFRTKASALRLQWFRRFLSDSSARWKDMFNYIFFRAFNMNIRVLLAQRSFRKARTKRLPLFYHAGSFVHLA